MRLKLSRNATQAVTRERSDKPVVRSTTMKYAVEAIGTMFLVFTIGTAVRSGNPLAPLAIGAALMAMVYAVVRWRFNPAVAIGGVAMGMFSGSMI